MTARLATRPFWYLRHGETDWNAQGLSQGRSDIALNEKGMAQAKRAAGLMAAHWHDHAPITRIVASPLIRAWRTAEIVAEALAEKSWARVGRAMLAIAPSRLVRVNPPRTQAMTQRRCRVGKPSVSLMGLLKAVAAQSHGFETGRAARPFFGA